MKTVRFQRTFSLLISLNLVTRSFVCAKFSNLALPHRAALHLLGGRTEAWLRSIPLQIQSRRLTNECRNSGRLYQKMPGPSSVDCALDIKLGACSKIHVSLCETLIPEARGQRRRRAGHLWLFGPLSGVLYRGSGQFGACGNLSPFNIRSRLVLQVAGQVEDRNHWGARLRGRGAEIATVFV